MGEQIERSGHSNVPGNTDSRQQMRSQYVNEHATQHGERHLIVLLADNNYIRAGCDFIGENFYFAY